MRDRIDRALAAQFALVRGELAELGDAVVPLIDGIEDLMSGGKRLRPAFCYWGYRGAGGTDGEPIVTAAASFEFFQAGALLHDDVMDRSDSRRGKPTLHKLFEARHAGARWSGDAEQYGVSAAVLAGDLCVVWNDQMFTAALRALASGGMPAAHAQDAQIRFDRMRNELMAGQFLDVFTQAAGHGDDPVGGPLRVIRYKSAKYSVECPLTIGAALAGAGEDLQARFSTYGLALGEAFQLRDDLLGVFGDPQLTGKPAGDDLREGKRTVLIGLTQQACDDAGRALLDAELGRADLDDARVDRLRELIAGSGAVPKVEAMIAAGVERAATALDGAHLPQQAHRELTALITAATARVS